jgi:hypothetical protein
MNMLNVAEGNVKKECPLNQTTAVTEASIEADGGVLVKYQGHDVESLMEGFNKLFKGKYESPDKTQPTEIWTVTINENMIVGFVHVDCIHLVLSMPKHVFEDLKKKYMDIPS